MRSLEVYDYRGSHYDEYRYKYAHYDDSGKVPSDICIIGVVFEDCLTLIALQESMREIETAVRLTEKSNSAIFVGDFLECGFRQSILEIASVFHLVNHGLP